MVLREGLRLTAIGVVTGMAGAWALARLLVAMLGDVRPGDPLVLGATVTLLGAAAVLASWLPARRAARVDPMAVLRYD